MDVNETENVRKRLKLRFFSLYGKSVYDPASAVYHSGGTKATWPEEIPEFIDGREDKSKPWMRI